jgi:biotin transport system substrate-specific component
MSSIATPPRTLVDALAPRRADSWLRDALLVLGFSAFVGLAAQPEIRLGYVPLTLQTLAVLLTGALLGSRRGALALLLYLAQGAAGLPVFAGGAAGVGHLLGPTAGYLIAFPIAAGVVGWLAERGWDRHALWTVAAMIMGNLVIYALGVGWLALYVGSLGSAITNGMLPFLAGDLIKIAVAAAVLPCGWALVRRAR